MIVFEIKDSFFHLFLNVYRIVVYTGHISGAEVGRKEHRDTARLGMKFRAGTLSLERARPWV